MPDQPQTPSVFQGNSVVPLESVLCTEELSRRPPRPPDYEKENRALAALARALASSPHTVLQDLADTILDVFDADSAGISLLTDDGKWFHWPAIAGMWQPHRGRGTPRDFGPCGDVLDRNTPLMFKHFERRYTYFVQVTPPVEECLLVPFSIKGRAVGTIWAIAHDDRRKFDAEDMRQLVSLSEFASAAYQVKGLLEAAEERGEALAQTQADLSQRLAALQAANAEIRDSRRAALNLMEDAVLSREAVETLNATLHERERRFREMVDALPAAIYTTDAEGRLTHFNPAAVELSGRTPDISTDRWHVAWKLYRPDGTPVSLDESAMAIALKEGRVLREEIIIERPDGTRRWCMPHPTSLHDPQGRLIGGINMLVDITDRRQAEDALRQSEATFRALADASPGLIWRLDRHGGGAYVNRRYLEYFGKTAQEVSDYGWHGLLHPDDAPGYLAATAASQSTKTPLKAVTRVKHNTGSWRWIESHGMPLFGDNGEYAGHVGVSLDITERRQYEEFLSEADRHKNEFLAMLAHELRNPLAPILVSIEIIRRAKRLQMVEGSDHRRTPGPGDEALERRADLNHGVDHALDVLQRQVGQMVRLVDDLLDAARISRGKMEIRRERVEVSSVVHQAVEAVRPLSERLNHELTVTLPSGPVYLNADPARMSQVVGNLLNNACKFTPQGGHIWLTVEREDASDADHAEAASIRGASHVAIRVRDTGIGIAAGQRAHVFDLFTQIDTSLERSFTGLGIGLTLVKTLTEMHGGTVEVSSAGVGHGCEFLVRVPILVEADAPASRPPETRAAATGPLRILIVDDNHDSADMLAMLLQFSGHETHTAHDGLAAVMAAAKLQPDVIFLDIGLPLVNGYEAAQRIREQQQERRPVLVALTGWGQDEDRRRSEEAGFDAHMVKPIDEASVEQLLARIGPGKSAPRS